MKRAMALLGSAIFLVIAPGTLAVYVPWTFTRWRMAPPLFGFSSLRILGGLMIAAGLPVLLDSFARFAIQGLGTPAPIAPPDRKSTRLNSSHSSISYAVFCLKKKKK